MTYFIRNANKFTPADESAIDLHHELPPGNYVIKTTPRDEFYFEQVDSFTLNHKIYGDTLKNVDRIINTFTQRPNSTGVMLNGEKGSGKTMMAKALSAKCAELGMPTIIINQAWNGDEFNTLIQSVEQPCVILFDEFEKTYDREHQPAVLTLLDGVFPSRKLFILTCNDKYRVDEHMRNRPGRIYYMLDFTGLDVEFITEYCEENLNDKAQIEHVCKVSTMFAEFNFDMLKALCEEMNRYNESAQEAIKMLNAKPQTDDGGEYSVILTINGKEFRNDEVWPHKWTGNPLAKEKFKVTHYADGPEGGYKNDDDAPVGRDSCSPVTASSKTTPHTPYQDGEQDYEFTYLNLKKVDANTGSFTYVNDTGVAVTFAKIKKQEFFYAF